MHHNKGCMLEIGKERRMMFLWHEVWWICALFLCKGSLTDLFLLCCLQSKQFIFTISTNIETSDEKTRNADLRFISRHALSLIRIGSKSILSLTINTLLLYYVFIMPSQTFDQLENYRVFSPPFTLSLSWLFSLYWSTLFRTPKDPSKPEVFNVCS